jgi:hypothetical protein
MKHTFAGKFCGIFGKACFVGAMDTGNLCLIDSVDAGEEDLTGVLDTVEVT